MLSIDARTFLRKLSRKFSYLFELYGFEVIYSSYTGGTTFFNNTGSQKIVELNFIVPVVRQTFCWELYQLLLDGKMLLME
jgi:hypothetical protein